jgi:hypothetical protein
MYIELPRPVSIASGRESLPGVAMTEEIMAYHGYKQLFPLEFFGLSHMGFLPHPRIAG